MAPFASRHARERSVCVEVPRRVTRRTGLGPREPMSRQRRRASRRGRRWDEDSIRDVLREFLKDKTHWPTYDEFAAAGLKGMRDVLPRFGGPERWWREMGLQGGPRRWGGKVRWTDEAIHAALAPFLAGRTAWPSHRDFRRAGLGGLYAKLIQEGTLPAWATRFGIDPPKPGPTPKRSPRRGEPVGTRSPPAVRKPERRWTDERIHADLAVFLEGRTEWPPYREFVDNGHLHVYKAVLSHGGTGYWANRMNVRKVPRRGSQGTG